VPSDKFTYASTGGYLAFSQTRNNLCNSKGALRRLLLSTIFHVAGDGVNHALANTGSRLKPSNLLFLPANRFRRWGLF
jgi:hypothetical protein